MKKNLYKILVFTIMMIGISFVSAFASDISEQIKNTKCITEFSEGTEYDDFDTVTFGEYPCSGNFDIETDGIKMPIEWFVLEKQGDKALLLSKYHMGYFSNKKRNYHATSWKNSFLYNFLNQTFINKAFSSGEQTCIVDFNDNGRIFVPSYEEVIKYFGIDRQKSDEKYMYFNSKASKATYKFISNSNNMPKISDAGPYRGYCLRDIYSPRKLFWVTKRDNKGSYVIPNAPTWEGFGFGVSDSDYDSNSTIYFRTNIRPAMWVSLSNNGNQNSRNINNVASQQNNTGKDSNTIAGLPSVQSEYRNDGHFYLNNNMQKSTWVYYVTYYYHVDGAGNIEKSKWIEQRYVGSDGRMYRGRQTPDGKWVGDDGLVVNVSQDLSHSLTIEAAEPDSWYKTQSGLWYYFENDRTTTKKGWFTDARDNQTYYLDPSTGIMAVGWTTINGSQYYFNESHNNENNWYETGGGFYESYGKKTKAYGSMFRNEKTPDGHQVDANGKKIK